MTSPPSSRPVTRKDLIVACVVVAYLLATAAAAHLYSRTVAGVMAGIAVVALIGLVLTVPDEQMKALGQTPATSSVARIVLRASYILSAALAGYLLWRVLLR